MIYINDTYCSKHIAMTEQKKKIEVAYFSMEMMLETDIPSYAGGLGVLAGDLLRSMADMKIPAVGVSLVYSGNVFDQVILPEGTQDFREVDWRKMDQLTKLPNKISLKLNGETVNVRCWRYDIVGLKKFLVPVYLLDTDFSANSDWAKQITRNLYDQRGEIRICQELVLGVGGVKMLKELGIEDVGTYHMNEGHSSFVSLALLGERDYKDEEVKKSCVFTTHTPIPEGHDRFGWDMSYKYAGNYLPWHIKKIATEQNLSMTHLGLNMSKAHFGVSKKHGKVSRHLFPGYEIDAITNGVHHRSWIGHELQDLFDKYLTGYLDDPQLLEKAPEKLPDQELWNAHQASKRELIYYVNSHLTSINTPHEKKNPPNEDLFDENTLTIALARRPVSYKRPLLLYHDLERFVRIGAGKVQIIQCGKSHPTDDVSKSFVHEIVQTSKRFRGVLRVVYLENYSPRIARFLVAGCDVWLNTPMQPLEASGTSGMKAALNGVLNFSIPDGWWIEGYHMNPDAGFCIGEESPLLEANHDDSRDANALYETLKQTIIPMYYQDRKEWIRRMKQAITLGAYFNTNRTVKEYQTKAYRKKYP